MSDPVQIGSQTTDSSEPNLVRRYAELSALYAITSTLSHSLDLKTVLKEALDKAVSVTGLKSAGICLFDPEYRKIMTSEHSDAGVSSEFIQSCLDGFEKGEETIASHVVERKLPVVIDGPRDESSLKSLLSGEPIGGMVSLPLAIKGKVVGVLCLAHREDEGLREGEMEFFGAIANQIGIAIEHARLYERAGRQAMIEERERLAREIHDGLAQTLAYLNMQTQLMEEILSSSAIHGDALREMSNIRQGMNTAYQDLRVLLSGMKTHMEEDLYRTLDDYIKKFGMLNRLETHLIIEDRPFLPPMVEAHLLRIIQEAMANVRKHSRASQVTVRVGPVAGGISALIEDDGRGFDAGSIRSDGREHFGLTIMQERVDELGGSLTIQSKPGSGTRVTVQIPLHSEKSAAWSG